MKKHSELVLSKALEQLSEWENSFGAFEVDSSLLVPDKKIESVFRELVQKLKCNYPFHHPAYAGQMLKPPHEIAWAAYSLAMRVNPNNHALDGGPPSSEMEKEVIKKLASFFGYEKNYLGHLTSSGTIGNLEALWVSRKTHPNKKVIFSENAHYTHQRMCEVLEIDSETFQIDDGGNFIPPAKKVNEIGTIVVTLGTTGLGEVEPLDQILSWAKEHEIRIHIDSAYGGFFRALMNTDLVDGSKWRLMQEADSIVVDPHKHGLQPYGCGCVLFKDASVGKFYKHDSPYTYFSSEDLHLGEISLECSRAGAAAVALWATLECFHLVEKKGFGLILTQCRKAAIKMGVLLNRSKKYQLYQRPELDIVAYFPKNAKTTSEISKLSKTVFESGMRNQNFYVSLYKVPSEKFSKLHPHYKVDSDQVTILRSVLMKPEHHNFVDELLKRLEAEL